MLFLNKLLNGVKDNPKLFKEPRIGFILGLTNTQIKDLKKFATANNLITQQKQEYFLTDPGIKYLETHPIESWCCQEFPKRPELNLEYMKLEKMPATVTKAVRNLARHLLDGEELKQNSMEDFIQEELLSETSAFKPLTQEFEELLSQDGRVNLANIYDKFLNYGLTKSIIHVLLLGILSKNKDSFAVYEKYQFQLKINQLLFDKMMFYPENFELYKAVFEKSSVLEDISIFVLPNKTANILDITKGLVDFIRKLDKYTLYTERLSTKALKLRNAVINAKDPINLLTIDVPRIIQARRIKDCDKEFVALLKETLAELNNSKDEMVKEIYTFTLNAFKSQSRQELAERFEKVEEFIGAKELKTLYANITNMDAGDSLWIERIATFINKSRVPKDWTDEDVADYKVKIKELALKFAIIESTAGRAASSERVHSLLNSFLQLSKPEQNQLLRRVVNY